jgi:hypothetical protein
MGTCQPFVSGLLLTELSSNNDQDVNNMKNGLAFEREITGKCQSNIFDFWKSFANCK